MHAALRAEIDRRNLLRHSFYERWVAGQLSLTELKDYSCQYAHVVRALPDWLGGASLAHAHAADELREHAAEETAHCGLWAEFAAALGVSPSELQAAPANATTLALLDTAMDFTRRGYGAAVAWAVESQSPDVSASKLEGIRRNYPQLVEGERYFVVHAHRDVEHSESLERLMASDVDGAVRAARAVLDCMWDLLTSVERAA
jgi:pyrroloquinoline quinone (PQQ) biosynthesis protein C